MTDVRKGTWVVLIASALSVVLIGGTPGESRAQSKWERRDIDTTLAFNKNGTVLVGTGSGTITVTGWDESTIRIVARGDGGPLRFEATSSRVVVEATRSHDDVVIRIMVPRGARVVAHTNSGDITIRETRGDVEARTSSGDVMIADVRDVEATTLSGDLDVRQVSGATTVSTNNGDCSVMNAKGNVEASSVSGDIRIRASTSKIVRGRTTAGDVYYEGGLDAEGRYEFVSHAGEIDLAIPKESSALISVTTFSGTVDSDFEITLRPGFNSTPNVSVIKRYTFTIGAGSARVTVETFSGDISITSKGAK